VFGSGAFFRGAGFHASIMVISEAHGGLGRMLVLSRKRDERIVIADNIVITVVEIRGDKVRLGIQAPAEIPVHRREVYERIQAAKRHEADAPPTEMNPPA